MFHTHIYIFSLCKYMWHILFHISPVTMKVMGSFGIFPTGKNMPACNYLYYNYLAVWLLYKRYSLLFSYYYYSPI